MTGTIARMSALPTLQFCGQAQILGESLGAGRPAAIGTAFHAKCSGAANYDSLRARLTEDEQEELDALIPPADFEAFGVPLTYAEMLKEVPVALDKFGGFLPYDHPDALVRGTLDMACMVVAEGMSVALVIDIKKSAYAVPDGARSLQIKGYAKAYAEKMNADAYVTGVWDATEGQYEFSDFVRTFSNEADNDWATIKAAAENHGGEYSLGGHCVGCYGRKRCPQWLLPLELADTSLSAFTAEGGLTAETALDALILANRAKDTAKAVIDIVKHFSRDNGGIEDFTQNKVWAPNRCKGKVLLNRKRLETDHPELVQQYMEIGQPYDVFRWLKVKGKK
jgi:hypothetical protein